MSSQIKRKLPSSSSKQKEKEKEKEEEGEQQQQQQKQQQQGLLPLLEKGSSSGIRAAAGLPVSCLHHGVTVLTDGDARNRLLDIICEEFIAAFNVLPVEECPDLVGRMYVSGHCLGLLEPRSNIIMNAILHSGYKMNRKQSGSTMGFECMTDALRDSCLQKQHWRVPAKQSLDGLVVFLMFYFRYLSSSQAMRYLYLARCDLVLAIGLVESDFLMNTDWFTFHESAGSSTRSIDALYLASIAAQHPYPDMVSAFAARNFKLYGANQFSSMMKEANATISVQSLGFLITLLKPKVYTQPYLSASGLRHTKFSVASAKLLLPDALNQMGKAEKELCEHSAMIEKILLDAMYGYYMKAFDCLATALFYALQTAILRSGLCFGPFDDPVENILMNAIWFKNAFPDLCPELKLHLVHSEGISKLCRLSLDAHITFLCTKYKMLSPHDAILILYQTKFNRGKEDNLAMRKGYLRYTDDHSAVVHALRGTKLPKCDPYLFLFHSIPSGAKDRIHDLLCQSHHKRNLNLFDLGKIADVLKTQLHPVVLPPSRVCQLSDKAGGILTKIQNDFKHKEKRIKRKLKILIETFYRQDDTQVESEAREELSKKAKESVEILCIFGGQRTFSRSISVFHVNFLARDTVKTKARHDFFFAQVSESMHDDEGFDKLVNLGLTFRAIDIPLSSQFFVWASATCAGRCLPCERAITKVIHPIGHEYVGKTDKNFVGCLDEVYGACKGDGDAVFESQCVYFNGHCDIELAQKLEGLDELEIFLHSD